MTLKLDAATASTANTAYQEIAKLDKQIATVIELSTVGSIQVKCESRTHGQEWIGIDHQAIASEYGAEAKALVLRFLYQRRAPLQRKLAQLGFACPEAPR